MRVRSRVADDDARTMAEGSVRVNGAREASEGAERACAARGDDRVNARNADHGGRWVCGASVATTRRLPRWQCGQRSMSRPAMRCQKAATDSDAVATRTGAGASSAARAWA